MSIYSRTRELAQVEGHAMVLWAVLDLNKRGRPTSRGAKRLKKMACALANHNTGGVLIVGLSPRHLRNDALEIIDNLVDQLEPDPSRRVSPIVQEAGFCAVRLTIYPVRRTCYDATLGLEKGTFRWIDGKVIQWKDPPTSTVRPVDEFVIPNRSGAEGNEEQATGSSTPGSATSSVQSADRAATNRMLRERPVPAALVDDRLSACDRQVLDCIALRGRATVKELIEACDWGRSSTYASLGRLVQWGWIQEKHDGRTGRSRLYVPSRRLQSHVAWDLGGHWTPRERSVLAFLSDHAGASVKEMVPALGYSRFGVQDALLRLMDRGLVVRSREGGRAYRYRRRT